MSYKLQNLNVIRIVESEVSRARLIAKGFKDITSPATSTPTGTSNETPLNNDSTVVDDTGTTTDKNTGKK